ncbi:hypothetical protein CIB84_015669 [Bambusicola thoracicus]|uniref:Uncharacterized protein n=1 Tax=Bambusicola thoracicus TaxID=9083 RepID=A0A2P4S8Y1_BAMTH|nr:hypothetical protein CIB84_015669 [Bambusicola thoracicus]
MHGASCNLPLHPQAAFVHRAITKHTSHGACLQAGRTGAALLGQGALAASCSILRLWSLFPTATSSTLRGNPSSAVSSFCFTDGGRAPGN